MKSLRSKVSRASALATAFPMKSRANQIANCQKSVSSESKQRELSLTSSAVAIPKYNHTTLCSPTKIFTGMSSTRPSMSPPQKAVATYPAFEPASRLSTRKVTIHPPMDTSAPTLRRRSTGKESVIGTRLSHPPIFFKKICGSFSPKGELTRALRTPHKSVRSRSTELVSAHHDYPWRHAALCPPN